jgi:hypothetical protein
MSGKANLTASARIRAPTLEPLPKCAAFERD